MQIGIENGNLRAPGSRALREPSGHVFVIERQRGPQWYAKYRLPEGRQVQKRIGSAWTEPGGPAPGYINRKMAETWLAETLSEARRGTHPGLAFPI
jgi:integrase